MNIKDKPTIYLMPGMAASPKIFERLHFPNAYDIHLLDWIMPEEDEQINYKKVVIISSVKTQYELPKKMLLARYTYLHKLLPVRAISHLEFWKRFSFSEAMNKRLTLYEKYIGLRSPSYLDWSIDRIVNWQQKEPLPRTIHIHGDKDSVFPIQYIKNATVIHGGTHIMIINRYKWFNEHLINMINV